MLPIPDLNRLRAYYAEDYLFHGPGGDLDFDVAARTTFCGDFTGVFTFSPIGPLQPTGQHVGWEVIHTFRYDDDGRLAEEWVQADSRSLLTKLGVTAVNPHVRS